MRSIVYAQSAFLKRLTAVACAAVALCLGAASVTEAARLIDHGPITDEVYMLWFRDGQYEHGNLSTMSSVAWQEKLDTATARLTSTYSISSSDDGDFSGGVAPTEVGRKSKGSDFRGLGSAEFFQDHWMFLRLPSKFKRDKNYTIDMGGIGDPITFTFSEFDQRNEAIHVSHYGYSPRATAKHAYISHYMGDFGRLELEDYQGAAFHIVKDGSNEIVYSGTIAKRKDLETDPSDYYPDCPGAHDMWFKNEYASYTMADVWECDFSDFQGAAGYDGKYKVVVEGLGCSYVFDIATDVYYQAWKDCMLGIYHQRCGIPLEEPYTTWTRPACHRVTMHQATTPGENGSEAPPSETTGETYDDIWGGYHDACDYDKWVSHMEIAQNLLLAYELRPTVFVDGELSIPENNNDVPDILDEAAWGIAFFMRMQRDNGGVRGTQWTANGTWYVGPVETGASLKYSVVANALAYCMQLGGIDEITGPYYQDVDLSRTNLLASAKSAYDWAMAEGHTPGKRTGLLREAHAWMFKVTEETQYQDAYILDNPITTATTSLYPELCGSSTNPYSQEGDWNLQDAVIAYVLTDNANVDQATHNLHTQAFLNWTTYDRIEPTGYRGFRLGHHRRMPPLIGVQTSPQATLQAVAGFGLTDNAEQWINAIYPGNDYCLGGNEMNMCFMSQCGHRYPKEIMHTTTWQDPKGCAKGIIPYGTWNIGVVPSVNSVNGAFAVRTCYPLYVNWGQFELFWENRYLALGNEFTTPQTNGVAAFAYAVVKDGGPADVGVRNDGTVSETIVTSSQRMSVARRADGITLDFADRSMRTVRLLDIAGRCVYRYTGNAERVSIPVSTCVGGCYLVKVSDSRKTTALRVTVMR